MNTIRDPVARYPPLADLMFSRTRNLGQGTDRASAAQVRQIQQEWTREFFGNGPYVVRFGTDGLRLRNPLEDA